MIPARYSSNMCSCSRGTAAPTTLAAASRAGHRTTRSVPTAVYMAGQTPTTRALFTPADCLACGVVGVKYCDYNMGIECKCSKIFDQLSSERAATNGRNCHTRMKLPAHWQSRPAFWTRPTIALFARMSDDSPRLTAARILLAATSGHCNKIDRRPKKRPRKTHIARTSTRV